MKAAALLIAFAMGAAHASGGSAHPAHRAQPPKAKAADLDLNMDFAEDDPAPAPHVAAPAPHVAVPPPRMAAPPSESHAWIYWTMGATVAAGGLGWYLHENQAKQSAVTRTEQVFTDDR